MRIKDFSYGKCSIDGGQTWPLLEEYCAAPDRSLRDPEKQSFEFNVSKVMCTLSIHIILKKFFLHACEELRVYTNKLVKTMQFFPDLISGPSSSICNCPATLETRSAAAADKTAALSSSSAAVMTTVQVPSKTESRNKTAWFF